MSSKNNYLYINTTSHQNVNLAIIDEAGVSLEKLNYSVDYQFKIKDELLVYISKLISQKTLAGIVCVTKSQEMTSLRIGISTANALAYVNNLPIIGIANEKQIKSALKKLAKIKNFKPIKPIYEINPMLKKTQPHK
jgi:hypothetical protein